MTRRKRRKVTPLPLLMAELTFASWETIARRSLLMATGRCSRREYDRMVSEKVAAAMQSARRFAASGGRTGLPSLLTPFRDRAAANASRLRRRRRV